MFLDFAIAVTTATFVAVVPGYFLSRALVPASGVFERLLYSTALSVALSSAIAVGAARLTGSGVTLAIAVAAPLILASVGLVALLVLGPAEGKDEPLVPSMPTVGSPVFIPLSVAGLLMLGSAFEFAPLTWTAPATLILVVVAGALHLRSAHDEDEFGDAATDEEPYSRPRYAELPIVRRAAFAVVLGIVLVKGYVGPILNDWPFIRGVDHYSHAVMANLMMERGQIDPYLIYPPGFHTLTAMISHISSLDPLEIFPVLGPTLLLLPTLAIYVLGRKLFGTWAGILAMLFLSMAGGTYQYFEDAMYPNMITSQFLLVAAITGLVSFYRVPTGRSGAFLVLVGSSVTLFHPVASLYLALLLGMVGLFLLPHLLLHRRSAGIALFGALAALGVLAALYAWDTYDLPGMVGGLIGVTSDKSQTGEAVGMAVGTQMPYRYEALIGYILSQPVAWLGLFGLYVLVGVRDPLDLSSSTLAGKLARLTVLLWTFLLLAGSFTPMNGFPQRFARDLGVPLSLLAAFGVLALARSLAPLLLNHQRSTARPITIFAASLTVLGLGMMTIFQVYISLEDATGPSEQLTITAPIGEAGKWLEKHNEGGNVLISPHGNQVPSRMMLAMGDYFEYQSFENYQILRPRDLPPTGTKPLWDVYFASHNPADPHTQDILRDRDIRYVVLYKDMPDRAIKKLWIPFKKHPDLYSVAFENSDVLIVRPSTSASQ